MRNVQIILLCFAASVSFGGERGDNSIAALFEAENIDGTIVIATSDGAKVHVHNDARSKTRFSPASTFKILNSLIALDTGVVDSKDSAFKWDGIERGLPAWNRDQTLQSAFRVSCVWCYQEIAREVGESRYSSALAEVAYGNQQVGDEVDQFWLNGVLQVSALEQIDFLKKLVTNATPYQVQHVDIVKAIMLDEESTDYAVHAKSGWTGAELHVGWYVGYVEKGSDVWLFAMNMRMDSADQAALRKELTLQSLQALGIL